MTTTFNTTAKQIGDEIIDISQRQASKMERWSNVTPRPDGLGVTECVGFINKEASDDQLNLVVDLQSPASGQEAILRLWAINSTTDEHQIERFNNIQLNFTMESNKARKVAKKGAAITRDDLRTALHDQDTQLASLVVSNQSGFDAAAQEALGERYDFVASELEDQEDTVSEALYAVVATLKLAAA